MLLIIFIVAFTAVDRVIAQNCWFFNKNYNDAKSIVTRRREHELELEKNGFVLTAKDIGFERSRGGLTCNTTNYWYTQEGKTADYLNAAARLLVDRSPRTFVNFSNYAKCIKRYESPIKVQPKYRPLDAYGNNLRRPTLGTPNTRYGRQGPKNYDDGVSAIKKSVTGAELPNPRQLFIEVLDKAEVTPRTEKNLTTFFILSNLYLSHDQAHQTPVEPRDNCKEIRCCTSGNKKVLDPSLQHSACLPIAINKNDDFYGKHGVGCLNMVRSEPVSGATTAQSGEILNRVTAFVDHSMIYGSNDVENRKIRSFKGGKILLGKNGILPANSNGKYTKISDRLKAVPLGAILPGLFARNHNNLASGLAEKNPTWTDEKLFQETRRLNIALFEHLFFESHFKAATGGELTDVYKRAVDPSPTVEFMTGAYRFFHVFMNPFFNLVDASDNVDRIPMSETFGRIDLIEDRFDDALRGSFFERLNFDHFSEELYNKFAKNEKGIGLDVVSIDIQRCRDHGMPGYLEFRRSAGLQANFTTFDELTAILPLNHVNLLKKAYAHVEDIDLYVGGTLESFAIFDKDIVGETFGTIIVYQFSALIAGDAYYYTHKNSPYPFTEAQKAAIHAYDYQNLVCANSGLDKVLQDWSVVRDATNIEVPCTNYPQIDLSAWKGI